MFNFIIIFMLGMIPAGQAHNGPVPFLCPEVTEETLAIADRVVMSEASTEPYEGMQAVAAALINRVLSPDYPNTFAECIEGQFSVQDNGEPSEQVKDAVRWAFSHPYIFPTDMYWFRTDYYHPYGHEYTIIGRHYFSTVNDYGG